MGTIIIDSIYILYIGLCLLIMSCQCTFHFQNGISMQRLRNLTGSRACVILCVTSKFIETDHRKVHAVFI